MSGTLLLGIGNPILSDDGVGLRLVRDLAAALGPRPGLETRAEDEIAGFELLPLLSGYARVVIVDAAEQEGLAPGAWRRLTLADLRATRHLAGVHDANLATAIELGRRTGLDLPADESIEIIAVAVGDARTFGETLTPALERAYPALRAGILAELERSVPPPEAKPDPLAR